MSRPTGTEMMEKLVSLCKRRGFVFTASEIYGGINGFWDYGPLGVQLKNHLRDRWWHDMVECPPIGPDGKPLDLVGVDSSIIQNPKAWVASGHVGGFSDPMVDCRESKSRYRLDHVMVYRPREGADQYPSYAFMEGQPGQPLKKMKRALRGREAEELFEIAHGPQAPLQLRELREGTLPPPVSIATPASTTTPASMGVCPLSATPASISPGQRTHAGTRIPPSYICPFCPRHGPLSAPTFICPPLSDV